jgi:putative component of membrane protein insertase Oxa1/YidC/SpoIIIJ protein YidD
MGFKCLFLTYFFIVCFFQLSAQQIPNSLNKEIVSSVFNNKDDHSTIKKRKLLDLRNKKLIQQLNPFLYVGAGLLFIYQNIISEQIQASCMYQVSCSEYTKKSIEKNGFLKGTLLGFHQLSNCFQGVIYEHPPFMINEDGKINNLYHEINQ